MAGAVFADRHGRRRFRRLPTVMRGAVFADCHGGNACVRVESVDSAKPAAAPYPHDRSRPFRLRRLLVLLRSRLLLVLLRSRRLLPTIRVPVSRNAASLRQGRPLGLCCRLLAASSWPSDPHNFGARNAPAASAARGVSRSVVKPRNLSGCEDQQTRATRWARVLTSRATSCARRCTS